MLANAQKATSLEQDEELLSGAAAVSRLSGRESMAVVTRLGEKRLLRAVLDELELIRASGGDAAPVGGVA